VDAAKLDDETLTRLIDLSDRVDPPPWRSMAEGRDHSAGDTFIMVGSEDDRLEDLYLSRDSGPADTTIHDLVAEARNALPLLIGEIRRLRSLLADQ
jgi:hypothetical protein